MCVCVYVRTCAYVRVCVCERARYIRRVCGVADSPSFNLLVAAAYRYMGVPLCIRPGSREWDKDIGEERSGHVIPGEAHVCLHGGRERLLNSGRSAQFLSHIHTELLLPLSLYDFW